MANRNVMAMPSSKAMCCNCQIVVVHLKVCSQCKTRSYCTIKCQREDWKKHKLECKPISDVATIRTRIAHEIISKDIGLIYALTLMLYGVMSTTSDIVRFLSITVIDRPWESVNQPENNLPMLLVTTKKMKGREFAWSVRKHVEDGGRKEMLLEPHTIPLMLMRTFVCTKRVDDRLVFVSGATTNMFAWDGFGTKQGESVGMSVTTMTEYKVDDGGESSTIEAKRKDGIEFLRTFLNKDVAPNGLEDFRAGVSGVSFVLDPNTQRWNGSTFLYLKDISKFLSMTEIDLATGSRIVW